MRNLEYMKYALELVSPYRYDDQTFSQTPLTYDSFVIIEELTPEFSV